MEINTRFSTLQTIYEMEPVNTNAEKWITACSCGLEELSITKSLLFLYESLQLYSFFFLSLKSKRQLLGYWSFLEPPLFHIIKVLLNDSDF